MKMEQRCAEKTGIRIPQRQQHVHRMVSGNPQNAYVSVSVKILVAFSCSLCLIHKFASEHGGNVRSKVTPKSFEGFWVHGHVFVGTLLVLMQCLAIKAASFITRYTRICI